MSKQTFLRISTFAMGLIVATFVQAESSRQLDRAEALAAAVSVEKVLADARGAEQREARIDALARARLDRAAEYESLLMEMWGYRLTRSMVQGELDRVAREVVHRDLLDRVLESLDHDIDLYAALVVKPQLALREMGRLYERDGRDLASFPQWLDHQLGDRTGGGRAGHSTLTHAPLTLDDFSVHAGLTMESAATQSCNNWESGGLYRKPIGRHDPDLLTPAAWTGSRLVVSADSPAPLLYDPALRSWSWVPGIEVDLPLSGESVAWDGSELLLVSGRDTRYDTPGGPPFLPTREVATRVNLDTGRRTSLSGAPAVDSGRGYWTGSELLIWEGRRARQGEDFMGMPLCEVLDEDLAYRYDPTLELSATIPPNSNPDAEGRAIGWTGTELLVWGGVLPDGFTKIGVGEAFDPATDTWRPISSVDAPAARDWPATAWNGTEWFVFGGQGANNFSLQDGGLYNPATDSWRSLPEAPFSARTGSAAVWTGSEFLVFGDGAFGGYSYDPVTVVWTPLPFAGAPPLTFPNRWQAFWTGTRALFWDDEKHVGGLYDLSIDQWLSLVSPEPFAPLEAIDVNVISTGAELLSWGGSGNPSSARFDYLTASWGPMTTDNSVLAPRCCSATTWTGTEMLVWGGDGQTDGGRYDPATDTWQPMTTGGPNGTAQARFLGGVWTGSEFLVLAQNLPPGSDFASAEAYDPVADTWRAVTMASGVCNMPLKLVWMDSEAFCTEGDEQYRYDPGTDSWEDITDSLGEVLSDAIWNGSQLVAWADRQKRYDPVQNQWSVGPLRKAGNNDSLSAWIGPRLLMIGGRSSPVATFCGRDEPIRTRAWDFSTFEVSTLSASPLQSPSHAFAVGDRALVWEDVAARGAWLSSYAANDDVTGLTVQGKAPTTVTWDPFDGENLVYDVVSGLLSQLRTEQSLSGAVCRSPENIAPSWADDFPPPNPGEGFYYLVRARTPCSRGDWGSADVPRTTIVELCF